MRNRSGALGIAICVVTIASCAESRDINVVTLDGNTGDSSTDGSFEGGDADLDAQNDGSSDAPGDTSQDSPSDGGEDSPGDAPPDVTPDAMPTSGLNLFFKFEEASGNEFDYSGMNNHGTVSGPVARGIAGKVGLAVDFGSTGMIVAKSSTTLDMTTGGTIEFWIKLSSITPGNIVSRGTGAGDNSVRVKTAQGNIQVFFTRIGGTSAILTSASDLLPTGQWRHVAATNDGSNIRLYLNGNLVQTEAGGQLGSMFADLHVGKSAGADNAFNGTLDELRWWNVARSGAEICADAGGTTSTVDGATVCTIP